jgi:pyruvate carboxylase
MVHVPLSLTPHTAGADLIDCCIDSLSGLTSQPSMGAIVSALRDTPLDTGIDPVHLLDMSTHWEEVRPHQATLLTYAGCPCTM